MSTPEHTPAPAFRIEVCAFAWTPSQAERIKKQVEHMFAGCEVTISENPPAPPIVVSPPDAVPISSVGLAVTVPLIPPEPPPPAPPKTETFGEENKITLTVGDKLVDRHTGAIVSVTDFMGGGFVWENTNPDAKPQEKNGLCPFKYFSDCYEFSTHSPIWKADTEEKQSPEPKEESSVSAGTAPETAATPPIGEVAPAAAGMEPDQTVKKNEPENPADTGSPAS